MVPSPPRHVDNLPGSGQPHDVRNSDDDEDYERDGWRIGFDVSFHGVGIVENDNDSELSGIETPPIAAAEDSSSDAETDPDSDVEVGRRSEDAPDGYVALRTIVEDPSDFREDCEQAEEDGSELQSENFSHRFVSPGVHKDFEKALQEAESVYSNHSNEKSDPAPSSETIELNNDKISEIRKVMANVSIPEPYWAKDLCDTKVLELLEKLKRKERE